jgi:hypothetical protein
MENKYKIKEVSVELENGIKIILELNNIKELKEFIDDLKAEGLFELVVKTKDKKDDKKNETDDKVDTDLDDPMTLIELKSGIEEGTLKKKKIIAFKNNTPQLIRPGEFSTPTDALLFLIYATETGLGQPKIPFDDFKTMFDTQGIKSGSPLTMLLNNLKNANYIDKKAYDNERNITLTPKGSEKAVDLVKRLS